ncbi:lysoplasmalogenase family protein [Phenylobacterium sp.]|uniref:lysoplasmalogenase family protein n=1 Tax=Phenylobacterium sp. TaxID=1871053 RepID=UPI002737935C|nr:lysoplasmalogenase family protein [Phenylobacterium sp.]MDP3867029.1 lysoplasmalogenase family protein [Phenylobacterium sp.]
MDRPSLLSKLILALAILAGVSFLAANRFALPEAATIVWKGSGVALLALYAATRAKTPDGWLLAVVMALGATGDVLLETHGLVTGAVAFLAGHLVAIALYLRNRRPALEPSQRLLAILIVPATVIIAYLLPADRAGAPGVAFYSTGLALMAAAAWISRFPRMSVGLGALMFVASDLLIFARAGPLEHNPWVGFGVWALYFAGQLRICLGVVGTLARRDPQAAPSPTVPARA